MRPTNLLFILSDQHRRDASGCYGNPVVRTPNLDRLASRGVRFDNAYTTCPICVPARASLATGRYVHQIRYWDNAFPYEGRVPSWGHRLMADGHRVESIGKLHYRGLEGDEDGFGRKIVPLNVVDAIGDVMGAIRQDLPVRQGARQSILNAKGGASSYLEYDIEIANHACEWLREASQWDDEKPWVLFVSFVCPHPPFVAPMNWFEYYMEQELPLPMQCAPEDRPTHPALRNLRRVLQSEEPYSNEEVRRVTAAYYGACSALDERIGEVLSALDSSGLADSARVIYTSDHGESLGWRGHFGKMTMYEESAGVPLIVAGADAPPGEVLTDLTTWVDIYPTIVEAVGETLTEAERQLPGDSLWGIARGDSKNRIAFSEYHAV
ncbi:MAG: sulfatase-like hydrolase/transferase, partial [Candidatus Poribacteria bacterium]|nr:sulfatase-like hydrolase/transferase [Candidatus Poribacteria bacterium]